MGSIVEARDLFLPEREERSAALQVNEKKFFPSLIRAATSIDSVRLSSEH